MFLCLTSTIEPCALTHNDRLDALLTRLSQNDTEAFDALYREISPSVYALALSILKNSHDAQDVLHDCCLAVYSAAGSYRSQGKPLAWVLTIARNLCLRKLREYRRQAELPPEDWEPYLEAKEGVTPEDRLVIAACMELLSEQERQIVVLHAVAGFRHAETGRMLELPLPTVLSKYHRALKKLKGHLTKGEPNDGES